MRNALHALFKIATRASLLQAGFSSLHLLYYINPNQHPYKVHKWICRERDEIMAMEVMALTQQALVVDLSESLAFIILGRPPSERNLTRTGLLTWNGRYNVQ